MINYSPVDAFHPTPQIYDLIDFVIGGTSGTSNDPIEKLIDNTVFLESRMGRYDKVLQLTDNYTWAIAEKRSFLSFALTQNKTCQLPPVATVATGTRVAIATTIPTVFTANKCLKVRCDTANNDMINNGSSIVPYLYMHDGERLILVAAGSYWEVESASGNFDTVGDSFGARQQRKNTAVLNGTVVSRVDYGRMLDFILTLNDGQQVVSDATWLSDPLRYRSCFSWGDGDATTGTSFRLPDERAMTDRYLDLGRGVDFARQHDYPGGYEADAVLLHDHVMHGKGSILGAGLTWFLSLVGGRYAAGGGSDGFGGKSGSPDANMRTGDAGTGENLIKSIGKIPLIKY